MRILPAVFYHILFWTLLWMVPMILLPIAEPDEDEEVGIASLINVILMTGVFYFNLYVLYPRFLAQKQTITYIVLALLTGLASALLYGLIEMQFEEVSGPFLVHILLKSIIAFVFIACSTGYKTIRDSWREQRLRQQRENENLKTELTFLRSQISPHFMFNVLNTLVALIRQKSDKLEDVVIELSNLMRYMLYESGEEQVSLKTELEYLQSYIDIQTHRFGEDIKLNVDIPRQVPDKWIEPMLLIPLVENAFKHGFGLIDDPHIDIRLAFFDNSLTMSVKNKFAARMANSPGKNSGIGLSNLRKRLDLLYPQLHELSIRQEDNWFTVDFQLKLKESVFSKIT